MDKIRRFIPAWMGLLVLCAFAPLGISAYLRWLAAPELLCLAVASLSFVCVPFWAWRGDVMLKSLQVTHQVVCPSCGKPLIGITGELAMTTGRCGGCGDLIVEDAFYEPPDVKTPD